MNLNRARNGTGLNLLAKIETLSILYVSVFLTRIGFGVFLVIFPIYLIGPDGLPISSALLGIVLALYPALEGLSALPVGAWVDRSGRRRAFVLGMALITVLTAIISLTRNDIPLVGGAHAIMGFSAAMITISSLTMITDLTVVGNRGTGMGAFDMANLSGYGVGAISGLMMKKMFSQSLGTIFQIVAGMFAVAAVFTFLALREPPHAHQRQVSLKEMYDNLTGDMAAIFPLWFSLTVIVGFYLFLPKIAQNANFSLESSTAIFAIGLGLTALGTGSLVFGRLSDKIGRTRTMLVGVVGELGFLIIFPNLFQKLVVIPEGTPLITIIQTLGTTGIIGGGLFFMGSALIPSISNGTIQPHAQRWNRLRHGACRYRGHVGRGSSRILFGRDNLLRAWAGYGGSHESLPGPKDSSPPNSNRLAGPVIKTDREQADLGMCVLTSSGRFLWMKAEKSSV